MKQTKRHKLCFGTDKGKTFQNRINTDKNSGDSKTVTLVQKKASTLSVLFSTESVLRRDKSGDADEITL